MKTLTALLSVLFLAGAAWADEVFLRNGGKLEGVARQDGDRVVVEMKVGTVTLRASDVAEIVNGETPLHVYRQRLARVQSNPSVSAYFDLALWAKSKGLSRHVNGLLERVIALEPEHAGARKFLGHVFHAGRWMAESERQAALGFVQFRGRWVTPEERSHAVLVAEEARQAQERAAGLHQRKDSTRAVEATPYTLGIRVYPSRGSQVRSSGYSFWGGAWYLHGPRAFIQVFLPVVVRNPGVYLPPAGGHLPTRSGVRGYQGFR
jgi:hypothetical protein